MEEKSDIAKFHDDLKKLCRRGWKAHARNTGKPFVKPIEPGIVKGKLARKAAKKQRQAALKAAQVRNEQG